MAATLFYTISGAYAVSIPTVLLNNGVQFPQANLGTGGYNSSVAKDAFSKALSVGWTSVDTAYNYANADGIAQAIAASQISRKNIFVTSKVPGCGSPPVVPPTEEGCYSGTQTTLSATLKELEMEQVDMMLLHFPPGGPGNIGNVTGCSTTEACRFIQAQWRAMEEFYKKGGARAIGVSNYCVSCLECLKETQTVVPAINQILYHAGEGPGPTKSLVDYCAQHDIVVQAYSPLGGTAYNHPDDPYPLIHNKNLTAIGDRFNKSSVQVALRWVVQQGLPLATQSDRTDYMVEDTDIFDFELTEADMRYLSDTPIDPDDPTQQVCV